MADFETKKIGELKKGDNLKRLEAEVVYLAEKAVSPTGTEYQKATLADETGTASFACFGENIGILTVGDKIELLKVYIKDYNGDTSINFTRSSSMQILEKGNGTSKTKFTAPAPKSEIETGKYSPTLSARQTAIQAASRIHSGTSTDTKTVIGMAEELEKWLLRP